jgi:hypothetical protein
MVLQAAYPQQAFGLTSSFFLRKKISRKQN